MIHRFEIALADVDRGVYQDLDLRVARHPSEDISYLVTRVLAYALEYEDGLEFSKGLDDGELPAIWRRDLQGRVLTWIEIGSPLPDRLHRASKGCERVIVYCHRRPDLLIQRCAKERVHKAHTIRVVHVPIDLIADLEPRLDRNNRWDISVNDGRVTVVIGGHALDAVFVTEPLAQEP
ncbi:hypothetical protein LBMAG49_17880 [Planctomycetota bacterium]|jgi:uncharacterized protein YaeQ|nr:hypothetical protein LBMAG49_17880 [Planctomycetota bacterium]